MVKAASKSDVVAVASMINSSSRIASRPESDDMCRDIELESNG